MFYLLFLPVSPDEGWELFEGQDKVAHLVLFGTWTFLMFIGFARFFDRSILAVLIFSLVFAAGTEIVQSFLPGRSADWLDLAADLIGSVLAILVALFLKKELIRVGKEFY